MEREKILKAIKVIAKRLQNTDTRWVFRASTSLFIHGIELIPNDIDLVAHPDDYDQVVNALNEFIVAPKQPHGDTFKTGFNINDVECELFGTNNFQQVVPVEFEGLPLPVYTLEAEYEYYKSRTDKPEKNAIKIKLIEEKLGIK
ncbi:MAG: hypothetical protein Fur003_0800 [Candidatus Dojkabacteria bacterium]